MKIKDIAIEVGDKCNFKCEHCGSGDGKNRRLSRNEISLIQKETRKHKFERLLFVGGETTLHVHEINQVLLGIKTFSSAKVTITTNGYFAKTVPAARAMLSTFQRLDSVQLSYDKFHCKFLPFKCVRNLRNACKSLGIEFSVLTAIQDPMDLVLLKTLWKLEGVRVGISKVLPIGNAKRNNIGMQYPCFNKEVLLERCPGLDSIIYLCGRGFTSCCSVLTRNNKSGALFGETVDGFMKKPFYNMMDSCTFSDLAKKFRVSVNGLGPEYSSHCVLCGYIYSKKQGRIWLSRNNAKGRIYGQ